MSLSKTYKCHFCGKRFKRKTWFDKHECEKKRRFMDRHDIDTIRAHRVYNHWQRRTGLLRDGKVRTMDQFLNSAMYGAFKRLVEYAHEQNMFSPFKYIDYIVDNDIKERNWYRVDNIEKFQAYLRKTEDPETQARAARDFIEKYCEEHEIDTGSFFKQVSPTRVVGMVQNNAITPWVLFGYEPALDDLCSRINGEQLAMLDDIVNVDRWARKIEENPEGREIVRRIMEYDD